MSGIIGSKLNIRGSGLVGSLGTDGQHLLSAGAGVSNVFETAAAGGFTLASPVATTSGGTVTISTSIPSGTKVIFMMFNKVGNNSGGQVTVRIADSGGLETSGYVGGLAGILTATPHGSNYGVGFKVVDLTVAADNYSGTCMLHCHDISNHIWTFHSIMGANTGIGIDFAGGMKELDSELTGISVFTGAVYDAGAVSIMYSS